VEPQKFIRSWPALWLWMQHLNKQLRGRELGLTYTYRKGRLDIQFLDTDNVFLLSWEKKGNQVTITSSHSSSLPRKRVEVLRKISSESKVRNISIHAKDRLLRIDFSHSDQLILGFYPGANNVYYLSAGSLQDSFLKQDELPPISDSWLAPMDKLPTSIPGTGITHSQLMAAKNGLSADWENNSIIFAPAENTSEMNISEFTIDVLKHANRPKETTAASLRKTARTVLKRWKSKAGKIESELVEARTWPDLKQKLQALQIGLAMGMSSTDGLLTIPAELSATEQDLTIQVEDDVPLNQAIESTAKKIRKYQGKLDHLEDVLVTVHGDIQALEQLLDNPEDKQVLNFLQEHGESLDRAGKQQVDRKPYKKYQSPGGFDILVGRSSQDNDALTFKVANKNDWWFHARKVRGSHVILRTGSQAPQHIDIIAAAEHAARNSQAKHSGVVVVQYCQRKHLSKPKGAHPGTVLVHQEQSITINLD
jgi:predicted ribosome quality control (RQC) complex YloA/Tae2 family protein